MKVNEALREAIITIVYDNLLVEDAFSTSHGFACIVEGYGGDGKNTVLFDTGGDFPTLSYNMRHTGCQFEDLDAIIISHDHQDHTGGLMGVVQKKSNLPVYLPFPGLAEQDSPGHTIDNPVLMGPEPQRVMYGMWSSGVLHNRKAEQSLVLLTRKGIVVITGCAHPGIVRIVTWVKDYFRGQVYMVLGGFHRPPESAAEELLDLGVQYAAPSHCTGTESRDVLRRVFGENFISSGAGKVIRVRKLPMGQ